MPLALTNSYGLPLCHPLQPTSRSIVNVFEIPGYWISVSSRVDYVHLISMGIRERMVHGHETVGLNERMAIAAYFVARIGTDPIYSHRSPVLSWMNDRACIYRSNNCQRIKVFYWKTRSWRQLMQNNILRPYLPKYILFASHKVPTCMQKCRETINHRNGIEHEHFGPPHDSVDIFSMRSYYKHYFPADAGIFLLLFHFIRI